MTLTLQTIKDHGLGIAEWKLTKDVGSDLTTELSIGDVPADDFEGRVA